MFSLGQRAVGRSENSEKGACKGQLISKADWRTVDSPKKQKNEFDLFAVKSKKANKQLRSFINFLGEPMARQSAFGFI